MASPQIPLLEIGTHEYAVDMELVQDVRVRPIDEVPWGDAETVFGTRGDPATCWCQYYKVTSTEWRELGGTACATRLFGQVEEARRNAGSTPGLIAYLADEPVGWVAIEPRTKYDAALQSRRVSDGSTERLDDESVWAIVCFVVRVGYRRRGIASALISAAVSHARDHGARLIEGYPVDVGERQKVSAAGLYHGTVTLFEGAGFTVTARPIPGRALVTLRV